MPNPRSAPSFVQLGYNAFTFLCDSTIVFDQTKPQSSAQVGLAVTMKSTDTVGLPATTTVAPIIGQLLSVESGQGSKVGAVQTRGTVTFFYDDGLGHANAAPAVGDRVNCDEFGQVKTAAVLAAGAAAKTVGVAIVIDVNTTTKTAIVDLG